MSLATVQNGLIDFMRNDTQLGTIFSQAQTGVIESSGTAVVGTSTSFSSLEVGEFIGDQTHGYRRVASITDEVHLTVDSAFVTPFNDEAFNRSLIVKGMRKEMGLAKYGRMMCIETLQIDQFDNDMTSTVMAAYQFLLACGFMEVDEEAAENMKSDFDKYIRDMVDSRPTLGGLVIGTSFIGKVRFMQSADFNTWYAYTTLILLRSETRGNR